MRNMNRQRLDQLPGVVVPPVRRDGGRVGRYVTLMSAGGPVQVASRYRLTEMPVDRGLRELATRGEPVSPRCGPVANGRRGHATILVPGRKAAQANQNVSRCCTGRSCVLASGPAVARPRIVQVDPV